jgi:hypothetical protein
LSRIKFLHFCDFVSFLCDIYHLSCAILAFLGFWVFLM